jgi:hypothetical protein
VHHLDYNRAAPRFAALPALLFFLLIASPAVSAQSPFPAPSSANSLFQEKPYGPLPPPTPTPSPKTVLVEEEEKPIPAGWRIGGIVAAVLALAALLYGAARAWRSSNLFDRQYRFPAGSEAALRFGANRCGGHMATIKLDASAAAPRSKAKDA